MNLLSLFPFSLIIPVGINVGFGIYALRKTERNHTNLWFCLFIFAVAAWVFANFLFYAISQTYFLGKLMYAMGPLTVAAGLVWTLLLCGKRLSLRDQIFICAPYVILLALTMVNGLMVDSFTSLSFLPWPIEFAMGPLFPLFSIVLSASIVLVIVNVLRAMRRATGMQHIQLQYIFAGVVLMGLIPIFTSLLPPLFGIHTTGFLDAYSSFLWVALLVYAVTRYRFLDLRILLRHSVLKIGVVIVATVLVFAAAYIVYLLTSSLAAVISTAVLATLLSHFAVLSIFQKFFTHPLIDFSLPHPLTLQPENKRLIEENIVELEEFLTMRFGIRRSIVFLINWQERCYQSFAKARTLHFSSDHALVSFLQQHPAMWTLSTLHRELEHLPVTPRSEVLGLFRKYHAGSILPLLANGMLVGIVFFEDASDRAEGTERLSRSTQEMLGIGCHFGLLFHQILNYEALMAAARGMKKV